MTEIHHRSRRPASPRLERPTDSAFRGVCTALARTTGTDVVLWRVLFVVLAFFNGLGAVLYLAGIVTIPRQGQPRSLAERLLQGPDRHLEREEVVVLVVLGLATASLVGHGDSLFAAAVIAGLGVPWSTARGQRRPHRPRVPGRPSGSLAAPLRTTAPSYAVLAAFSARRCRRSRRAAVVVTGVLVLLGATGTDGITVEVVLSSALAVVGLGLVAGAWWGRSRGLIVLALLLGLGLAGTVAVRPALEAGVGERTWRPTAAGSYRLGVGEATLDLRDLPVRESGPTAVKARVDVGHLVVIVPDGLRVSLDAKAQLGDLLVLGGDTNGRDVNKHADLGGEGAPQVRLDLSVRTGQVEVRRG